MNKLLLCLMIGVLLFGCINTSNQAPSPKQEVDTMVKKTNTTADEEIVVFETNKGTIEVALNRKAAPITVENFVSYVKEGHYDGTVFHRVIPGFMIQGGGFNFQGAERPTNEPIKLESKNGLKNEEGTIAMARTNDPDSATAQFFINVKNNTFLNYGPGNPGYAVFGKVVSGMETVKTIEGVKTKTKNGHEDWPVDPVIINKVYMKE